MVQLEVLFCSRNMQFEGPASDTKSLKAHLKLCGNKHVSFNVFVEKKKNCAILTTLMSLHSVSRLVTTLYVMTLLARTLTNLERSDIRCHDFAYHHFSCNVFRPLWCVMTFHFTTFYVTTFHVTTLISCHFMSIYFTSFPRLWLARCANKNTRFSQIYLPPWASWAHWMLFVTKAGWDQHLNRNQLQSFTFLLFLPLNPIDLTLIPHIGSDLMRNNLTA